MNSKQRVHAALRRQPVDRVPIFMWFHPGTVDRLAAVLEVPRECVDALMGNDVRMTWVNNNYAMEAYHCCGALKPIIADLVEMGLDVLNPVQCNCPGMDPLELKREFGGELAFMGGVDTQHLLPHGTAAEVRRATRRRIDGMTADGGGYILAASHAVPPETCMENIFAMYAEAGLPREQIFDRAAQVRRRLSDTEGEKGER